MCKTDRVNGFEHIFLRSRFNKNVPVRWAPVVPYQCSKPHTPIFLFKNLAPRKICCKFWGSVSIEPPLENNLEKKTKNQLSNFFFFSSTEFNPEFSTTECTMQKQSAIKLSHKVAQSTSIFINKYRFNSILKKNFDGFCMQCAFWDLYLHDWKVLRRKKFDTLIYNIVTWRF